MAKNEVLTQKLADLPGGSGVYIMLDGENRIIYVGKARVLKNRVRQYFHASAGFNEKTAAMVERICDLNYVITPTEADALALEANLIKKYKPQYNILLKDDKYFPYIKIDLRAEYPSFLVTRRVKNDGCEYFGPYMGVRVSEVTDIINGAYPTKFCDINLSKTPKNHRPCLNAQIGKCLAPCCGGLSKEEYQNNVKRAVRFLRGDDGEIRAALTERMLFFSEREQYESAAQMRDRLFMLDKLKVRRLASVPAGVNYDVIGYHTDGIYGAVAILIVREGRMEGAHNFSVSDAGLSENDTLMSFLPQYYAGGHDAPKEILLAVKTDTDVFGQYLRGVYKKKIEVAVPQKGVKKELTEMAQVNAREYLYKFIERIKHKEELTEGAVYQLAELLRLHKLPLKMECYDISHISGTDKTASMTVFIGGEKQPALYRRFKIRVEGNDDFASMEEAVRRRLARAYGQEREDDSFSILPDLIVIDGGPGQLGRAAKALAEFGADVELISLAKREEEVYTLASNKPYVLPKSSLALRMLMRIRDEAHRFAVSYHRKLREKRIGGELEKIEGIGKVKRRALIDRFSSLENIKNASADELCETGGIDKKLAATIYGYFHTEEK